MLYRYILECAKLSFKGTWLSTTGLAGTALGAGIMTLHGELHFLSGDGLLIKAVNVTLSVTVYAIIASIAIFIFRLLFVSPFQLWKAAASIESIKLSTKQIREQIGRFITEGQALRTICSFTGESPPTGKLLNWSAKAEEFLGSNLDASYVSVFNSEAGISKP